MEFAVDIAMVVLEAVTKVITAVILQFVQCRGAEREAPAPSAQAGDQLHQQDREHREVRRGQSQSQRGEKLRGPETNNKEQGKSSQKSTNFGARQCQDPVSDE